MMSKAAGALHPLVLSMHLQMQRLVKEHGLMMQRYCMTSSVY